MVFAISNSRIMRERMRKRLEYLKKSKSNERLVYGVVDSPLYNKHISTDLNVDKVNQQSCLEMFEIW